MKSIKYLIFLFLIYFSSTIIAYADTTCVYKSTANNLEFTCTLTGDNITCDKTDNNSSYTYNGAHSFTKSAFVNSNNECQMDKIKWTGSAVEGAINITNLSYATSSDDNSVVLDLVNNPSGNSPTGNNGKVQAEEGEFDEASFCQASGVKGTFRAIGWVIVIIKIVVPILLIVFGSIDLAKAVVSSKDDEIKKSIKSIAVRVVAGVIIFFIPTLLDFAIGLVGGDEVYNENSGSFGYCTHCMLNPTDDSCGSLMPGGN